MTAWQRCSVLALVAAISLSACTGNDTGVDRPPGNVSPTPRGGVVRFGVLGAPATLDPYSSRASDLTWALARPVYPSLYRLTSDGRAEPYLGEIVARDDRGVTVGLRDVRWSNGRRVTVGDVISSWERAGPASGFSVVEDMTPVGRERLRLAGDLDDWERILATRAFVLPSGKTRPGVSAGPLTVARYVRRLKVVYERGPSGGDMPVDGVTVLFVDSVGVLLDLLETGELDAAAVPSTVNLTERAETLGLQASASLGFETVGLSGDTAGVADALDLDALHEALVRADGKIQPGADTAEAAGLGASVTLATPAGDELLALIQEVIQLQLQSRGITVEIIQPELETFYADRARYELRLERRSGSPADRYLPDAGTYRPLFQVKSYVLWRPGEIGGLRPHPTSDGPLAEVERWWVP